MFLNCVTSLRFGGHSAILGGAIARKAIATPHRSLQDFGLFDKNKPK